MFVPIWSPISSINHRARSLKKKRTTKSLSHGGNEGRSFLIITTCLPGDGDGAVDVGGGGRRLELTHHALPGRIAGGPGGKKDIETMCMSICWFCAPGGGRCRGRRVLADDDRLPRLLPLRLLLGGAGGSGQAHRVEARSGGAAWIETRLEMPSRSKLALIKETKCPQIIKFLT